MNRLAPRDIMPEHVIEIGYLTDLVSAMKAVFYNFELDEYHRPLSADLLAEWHLVHRQQLTDCKGFKHGNVPRFDGQSNHVKEIEFFDALIDSLKTGIASGKPADGITWADIETAERGYRELGDCKRITVWY